ncbi:MAG: hypothetical protein BWY80_01182 [Firmicutes bacterium ADurb.Bin456]|nr:MAG: hypothetical protein BWY80_01182 [Firmicutes bacterium ADurb.Bin456]
MPCSNISNGETEACFHRCYACQIIVHLGFQQLSVQDRSRGNYLHYFPPDNPPGGGGILDLFADRHSIFFGDKPGDISIRSVIGNTAHRDAFFYTPFPAGQGYLKFAGGKPGIVKKHFIKITKPKKKNGVRILLLNL